MFYIIKDSKLKEWGDYKFNDDCLELENVTKLEYNAQPDKWMIDDVEEEIDVPDYDEEGNPIMIPYEDKETVIDYDEEGNPIGSHEITVIKYKQSTHKEIITVQKLVPNPNWEQEQAEKEAIRIANLHMTRGDVFRGLLLAKGVTRADIRALIEAMPEETPEQRVQKELALIDFDEALEYYRGVALIDTVGEQLGITPAQMDKFFDTKDWHELISNEEE